MHQVFVDGKLNSSFRLALGCTILDRVNEYMALNRSRSLLISQVYCSAIPMLNCSMQLHFIVTQRELSVIKVNASLWHRLPAHQDSELFLPKHISTTGIYGSPTLETKTLSFDGLREETECYEMSSVKSA